MTTRGHNYHGGYVRKEYLDNQRKLCEENDGTCESPKDRYLNKVKDMLAYIDSIDQPLSEKIGKKLKNGDPPRAEGG